MDSYNGGLGFKASLDIKDFKVSAKAMQDYMSEASQGIARETESLDSQVASFAKNAAGYIQGTLIAGGFGSLVKKIVETRSEFQSLEIAFETMLGSTERASNLMNQLTQTAAKTPFDLQSLSNGAKQLMAYGIAAEDVNEILVKLGDIAAGMSLPLDRLVYLYGTTMVQGRMYTQDLRQFMGSGIPLAEELAKQFGVAKEEVGELVTAGKVTADVFSKALLSMASEGGQFFNLMDKQSSSLQGKISNLGDAWDIAMNEYGKSLQGVAGSAIDSVTTIVENLDKVVDGLKIAAATYGVYKASLIAVSLATKGVTGVTKIDNAVKKVNNSLLKLENKEYESLTVQLKRQREVRAQAKALKQKEIEQAKQELAVTAGVIEMRKQEIDNIKEYISSQEDRLMAAIEAGNTDEQEVASKNIKIAVQKLETAQTDLDTLTTEKNTKAKKLAALTTGKLTKSVKALWASMKANPIGLIMAAVTALIGIAQKFIAKSKEAREEQEAFNNEVSKAAAEPIAKYHELKNAWEGVAKSLKDKQKFVDDHKEALHGLGVELSNINQVEKFFTEEGTKKYIKAITARAKADAYRSRIADAVQKQIDAEEKRDAAQKLAKERQKSANQAVAIPGVPKAAVLGEVSQVHRANNEAEKYDAEVKKAQKEVERLTKQMIQLDQEADKGFSELTTGTKGETAKAAEARLRKEINALDKQLKNKNIDEKKYKELVEERNRKQQELDSYNVKGASSASAKQAKSAEDKLKEDERYDKERIALARQTRDSELEEQKIKINKEKEGFEKEEELRKIAIKQAKNDLDDMVEDWKQANIETNRERKKLGLAQFELTDGLTVEQIALKKQKENENKEKFDQEELEFNKKKLESLNQLIQEYGNLAQKEDLVRQKYEKLRKQYIDSGGNENDEAYRNINTRQDAEIFNIRMQADKMMQRAFTNATDLMKSELPDLLEYLRRLADETSDPEKMKVIREQIHAIEEIQRGSFSEALGNADFEGIIRQLHEIKSIKEQIANTDETDADQMNILNKKLEKAQENVKKMAKAQGLSVISKGFSAIADAVSKIADISDSESINKLAEQMSNISSIVNSVSQGAMAGGWIGALVGGITSVVEIAIDGITKNIVEASELAIEKQKVIHEKLIDDLKKYGEEYNSSVFGRMDLSYLIAQANAASEALRGLHEESNKRMQNGSWLQSDLRTSKVETRDFFGFLESFLRKQGFNLWDENSNIIVEEAERLMNSGVWKLLNNEQRTAIQNAIGYGKALEHANDEISNIVSNFVGNLAPQLADSMWDAIASGTDAWESWEQVGSQAITSIYKQLLQEMIMKDILGENENDLKEAFKRGDYDEAARIIQTMTGEAEGVLAFGQELADKLEEMGYSLSGASNSLSGAIGSLSEETGGLIAGRLNAMVINQASTNNILREQLATQYEIENNTAIMVSRLETIESNVAYLASQHNGSIVTPNAQLAYGII